MLGTLQSGTWLELPRQLIVALASDDDYNLPSTLFALEQLLLQDLEATRNILKAIDHHLWERVVAVKHASAPPYSSFAQVRVSVRAPLFHGVIVC